MPLPPVARAAEGLTSRFRRARQDEGARSLQTALVHNNTLRELTGFNNKVLDKDLRKWLKNARR